MDSFDQAPMATLLEQKVCAMGWLPRRDCRRGAGGTFTSGGNAIELHGGCCWARDFFSEVAFCNGSARKARPAGTGVAKCASCAPNVAHFYRGENLPRSWGLGTDAVVKVATGRRIPDAAGKSAHRGSTEMRDQDLLPFAVCGDRGLYGLRFLSIHCLRLPHWSKGGWGRGCMWMLPMEAPCCFRLAIGRS